MILKTKIIIIIALVITITIGVSTTFVLHVQSKKLIENEVHDVQVLSNIIERSIEGAMEDGNTSEVQNILENIGKSDGIVSLRIVSTDGNILKSKDSTEIGTKSKNFSSVKFTEDDKVEPILDGKLMSSSIPIHNKPQCYGCHSKNIEINGIIELTYDLSTERADIMATRRFLLFSNVVTVLIVAGLLSLLFSKYIMSPVKSLLGVIKEVESGNWKARARLNSNDELGILGDSFNNMIDEVNKLYDKNLKKEKEISKARMELEHKRRLEDLNSQLQFKVKEVETSNKAVLILSKEVKTKNVELEKMVGRLKKINEIGRVLTSIIETEELIKIIIKSTAELLRAEKGSIHLRKGNTTNLTLQYKKGLGVEDLTHVSLDYHPLYSQLLNTGSHVHLKDSSNGSPESHDEETSSAIGVPLKLKGQIIGGMLLENKLDGSDFTEDELDLLSTLSNQAMVSIENAWLYESVKTNYFGTIQALVNALEANDRYTRGHSERVRFLSVELAKFMGLESKEIEILEHAAILHDIGKIGIDSVILNKAGKLSSTEFSLIKAHPLIGDEILGPIGTLQSVRTTILQHHERYDGTGYPYGVAGEEISLKARILSVIDTFDAMRMDRPYRKALSIEVTKDEIVGGAGTQFDPYVTHAFIEMLNQRGDEILASAGYY